ncbi:MAG: hypothetical protein AMXMBFR84_28650 [Candidatus Hydrogenedentota bacterium]
MNYKTVFSGLAAIAMCFVGNRVHADFSLTDEAGKLTVRDGEEPVLVYNYEPVQAPEGVDAHFTRSSYLHPVYSPNGSVVTQDFPDDHYHHRGIFWGWPMTRIGDRIIDIWALAGAHPRFDRWLAKQSSAESATVAVENVWLFDDDPWPKVREQVYITVWTADGGTRAIDFLLRFQNITNEIFTIQGQDDEDSKQKVMKGYGGFNFRPDKSRAPFTFYGKDGVIAEDVLWMDTPWTAITWKEDDSGPVCGVATFQHPSNPDYPHGGWILRHYGFLGVSWPHTKAVVVEPADYIELRYRVLLFQGTVEEARVADRFKAYAEPSK